MEDETDVVSAEEGHQRVDDDDDEINVALAKIMAEKVGHHS